MAYQMAAMAVTLSDLEGHSPVAGLFECNMSNNSGHYMSNIYAAFYTISTDSVLAAPLHLLSFLYESGDYRYETSLFMLETRKWIITRYTRRFS